MIQVLTRPSVALAVAFSILVNSCCASLEPFAIGYAQQPEYLPPGQTAPGGDQPETRGYPGPGGPLPLEYLPPSEELSRAYLPVPAATGQPARPGDELVNVLTVSRLPGEVDGPDRRGNQHQKAPQQSNKKQQQRPGAKLRPHQGAKGAGGKGPGAATREREQHRYQQNEQQLESNYLPPTGLGQESGYPNQQRGTAQTGSHTGTDADGERSYGFEYRVQDALTGTDYAHQESRSGFTIRGVYEVLLPDGRRQVVHYEADENGFRPTITYEDPGSSSPGIDALITF